MGGSLPEWNVDAYATEMKKIRISHLCSVLIDKSIKNCTASLEVYFNVKSTTTVG